MPIGDDAGHVSGADFGPRYLGGDGVLEPHDEAQDQRGSGHKEFHQGIETGAQDAKYQQQHRYP